MKFNIIAGFPGSCLVRRLIVFVLVTGGFIVGAQAQSLSSVMLAWTDNSHDEQGFAVEKRIEGGAWLELASVGSNTTSYLDANAVPDGGCSYRVKAFNETGSSPYSNVLKIGIPETPGKSMPWLNLLLSRLPRYTDPAS